jgi:carboxymethylenebutenolidase
MNERDIDIQTKDGQMTTFIAHPEEGGPHPVILFLMDAPGKREELHDMVRRIASAGYYVILPNLYYRRVNQFQMTATNRPEMMEHMNSLTNALVCEDIQRLFEFAEKDDAAKNGEAGCVGYCMSGAFAFAAASVFANRISAMASIHGVRLFTDAPDSPHLNADKIKAEMYFACAETDEFVPKEMIDKLEAHLTKTSSNFCIEWYPGTQHAFVFPSRVDKYHQASAEQHWERLFSLFGRTL